MDVKLRGVPPFWVNYEGDFGFRDQVGVSCGFCAWRHGKKVVKWVLNLLKFTSVVFAFCVSILETTVYFLAGIIYTECE